jgi:hypothetical protein
MPRSNMRLALGGLVAVAVGIVGGWALLTLRPAQVPATVETASIWRATATSPDELAPSGRTPRAATPAPALATAPTPEAPIPTAPTPPRNAAPTKDEPSKPRIHLDGERSEFSYDGAEGGLYINKDRLSVRSPFGTFDIDW